MDGNAGIRGESVEMTRSGFERCSKNEQPTLAIENSLFVQRFLSQCLNLAGMCCASVNQLDHLNATGINAETHVQ